MIKKIVLSGGGSGGHITPLLAVARDLRRLDSKVSLHYVGERGGKFGHIAVDSGLFDECHFIYAGKMRRYHNEPLFERVTDYKTHLLNIKDIFKLFVGLIEATILMFKLRPSATLLKGGFVCVPVGLASRLAGSTIITHDSDALPGLSNRISAKFAKFNATAMPAKYYGYPSSKVIPVGLPISEDFKQYSKNEVETIKLEFGIKPRQRVMLVTGGSLGAKRLNHWVYESFGGLLKAFPDLFLIIIVGKNNMADFAKYPFSDHERQHIYAEEFTSRLSDFAGICDVAVIRAGATTIAEFAASKKPVILVPNPDLTGGHQMKNAKVYSDISGVLVVEEKELKGGPEDLINAVKLILNEPKKAKKLAENLHASLPLESPSQKIAKILLEMGEGR